MKIQSIKGKMFLTFASIFFILLTMALSLIWYINDVADRYESIVDGSVERLSIVSQIKTLETEMRLTFERVRDNQGDQTFALRQIVHLNYLLSRVEILTNSYLEITMSNPNITIQEFQISYQMV